MASYIYPTGSMRKNDHMVDRLTYPTLQSLMIAMARGTAVKIACFGDSTTDGNNTTSWTRNDSTGTIITSANGTGATVGQSDHNIESPNAYPAVLQTILRDMYVNTGIQVWNAGYSGQQAQNGWARANYANAVTNNPYYGKPHACMYAFGLNDANISTITIDAFVSETEKWVLERLAEDVLPILLTDDPHAAQGDKNVYTAGRENTETVNLFNNAIKALAQKYSIPCIDIHDGMLNLIDSGEWTAEQLQSDGLHFGNLGHGLKAGLIASKLYNNFTVSDGAAKKQVTWRNPKSNWSLKQTDVLGGYDNNTGGNVQPWLAEAADYTAGQVLMTLWIYVETSIPRLIYRGSASNSENVIVRTLSESDMPRIKAFSTSAFSTAYYDQPAPCSGQLSVRYAMSRPFSLCDLKIGLNKVVLTAPLSATKYDFWGGWFEINPFWKSMRKNGDLYFINSTNNSAVQKAWWQSNALKETGPYRLKDMGANAGVFASIQPEALDGSNCYSVCKTGDIVDLLIDARLGASTGITIGGGRILDGDLGTASNNERCFLIFNSAGSLGLYELGDIYTNTNSFYTLKGAVAMSWTADADGLYPLKCRVRIQQTDGHNYKVSVFNGWLPDGALLTSYDTSTDNHSGTADKRTPSCVAGIAGGLFFNMTAGQTREAEINQCLIRHYQ